MRINNQNIQVVNQVQAALVAGIAQVANVMIARASRISYLHSDLRKPSHFKPGSLMSWLGMITGEPALMRPLAACCSTGTAEPTRLETTRKEILTLS